MALKVALSEPVETITTFEQLQDGDVFTFRPDLGIWLVADGKPYVYDKRADRYALRTRGHGLALAYRDKKVLLRTLRGV